MFNHSFSSHRGAAHELMVATELIKRNCLVFSQLVGSGEVDLVCITPAGDKFALQVKTAGSRGRKKNKKIHTMRHARKTGGGSMKAYRYIDFFIGSDGEDFWIFPSQECQLTMKICGKESANKNAWHLIVKGASKEVERRPVSISRQLSLVVG